MGHLSGVKRVAIFVFCLLASGFTSGCGGGGGGGVTLSNLGGRAFDPNYVPDLKSLTHWSSFPVKVYFAPDAESTPERQALATAGFARWNGATDGQIRFAITRNASEAQLTVHFVPNLEGRLIGWTNWSYDGSGVIHNADTKIAVNGLTDSDITWVASHESGHALGMDGHSANSNDVMYATHVLGASWALTLRDENTVKTGYGWLFSAGAAPAESRSSGPLYTSEARCYSH